MRGICDQSLEEERACSCDEQAASFYRRAALGVE